MSKRTENIKGNRIDISKYNVKYFDYGFLVIVLLLLVFGLVMLYSTSSYEASLKFGDPTHYLKRQVMAVGLGILGLLVTTFVSYNLLSKLSTLLYIISVIACFLVIFIGAAQGVSSRWFYIGGTSVQPSEVGKVAVIMFLAYMISKNRKRLKEWKYVLFLFFLISPLLVVVGYNNLSTAVIILGIAFIMLFIASRQLVIFGAIGGLGVAFIYFFINFWGYRSDRIAVWKDPESYERGYQVMQGLYAIGSGGLWGKGLGESFQKRGYVPEAQNDMIFSIICEELGIVGAICVIVMYMLLLWRMVIIAMNAKDTLGSFIVVGVMAHIALQVILNVAVVTNTIPNTGVTLPFISYGGTSISILIAEMGLVLGVSRGINLK